LIDPKKRQVSSITRIFSYFHNILQQEYDIHGIWPPPEEQPSPTAQAYGPNYGRWPPRSNTFPNPFMSHRTGFPTHFSDPFSLFEQIFAGTSFARSSRHRHPFFSQPFDPFGHMDVDDLLEEVDRDLFGMRSFPNFNLFPQFPALSPIVPPSFGSGNGTRWISESFSSSMVNGVTQSIHKRVDSEVCGSHTASSVIHALF
jgi:DnaJ family protein B protein 6